MGTSILGLDYCKSKQSGVTGQLSNRLRTTFLAFTITDGSSLFPGKCAQLAVYRKHQRKQIFTIRPIT